MQKIWLNHYPKGVAHEINPDQYQSINEVFATCCRKFRDRTAFSCMGSELTYEELNELSADFASFLQNVAKIQPGDRVAIQLPNVLQYPVALFGILRAGGVVVNTNPLYTAREMRHQFQDAGVKCVVVLSNVAHTLQEILPETNIETVIVTSVGDLLGFPKSWLVNSIIKYVKKMVPAFHLPKAYSFYQALDIGSETNYSPVVCGPEDLAFLQYTGGTTGVSKGAMLTHRNIISNMLQIAEWMKVRLEEGKEVAILALPLYHIFSLTLNGLSMMILGGANLMVTNPRDIPTFIKILRTQRFTLFPGLNTLFNALMHHPDFDKVDFSQLKVSVAGGMALQTPVALQWKERTQSLIVEGYGLTETSPVVCVNPIDGSDKVGTIGLPVPSTEIKFIDDQNQEVSDQPGEICVRGPQVMKGYWQNESESKKMFTPDGWLKTGDIGVIDAEGFVKIVDRKKDMILVSGFNVYPNEIEDVVVAHPKVLEVAAIGVPDPNSTEAVKIFVVKKDESLTSDELMQHCRQSLTGYKVPKHIEFRSELPKSNVGKILRRQLREATSAT